MQKNIPDGNEFISLEVRASALSKILCGHNLHLTDIHCANPENKRKIQYLLLQAINKKSM